MKVLIYDMSLVTCSSISNVIYTMIIKQLKILWNSLKIRANRLFFVFYSLCLFWYRSTRIL